MIPFRTVQIKQQGFSLLELLIAFSILALSLSILLKIFSSGVNTAIVAEDYTVAVQIAESLMAKAGVETPLRVGQISGEENGNYHWLVETNPYQFNPEGLALPTKVEFFKVNVTVSWGDGNERQLELSTIKLVNKKS
ncbi:MAG: prepilin-type N-terminal cleavage/methylation domain-containing protein [Methylovulum sp.]|nr:prepilin-type N-terminal cleavage/methylation domain-containing protein [Methylovulum sp.]